MLSSNSPNPLLVRGGEGGVKSTSTLLLCSGGSSLAFLETLSPASFDAPLTIAALDERFSQDPAMSNSAALEKTAFVQHALVRDAIFNSSRPREFENMESCAERMEVFLRDWKHRHPNGRIEVIMGVGADGHTAGIAPMPDDPARFSELFLSDGWVVGYDAGARLSPPQRITVTLTFLRDVADHATVYAKREGKEAAIAAVESAEGSLPTTPARIIREMKDVIWKIV